MESSKSMPRVKELHKLFPRSKLLQDKFFEYYAVVVQLCRELFKISQRSTVAQLWTTFTEETYTEQLRKLSKAIHTEVYLETTKLVKKESKNQTNFRLYSREHMELQRRQHQQDMKQRILDACSQFDYRTIWKQTRKLGTTLLFEKAETYHEWVRSPISCTLVYSGRLGSGKSVLLANIVDDLHLFRKTSDSIIVHFFCRHDVEESLKPVVIMGCVARQILQHLSDAEALDTTTSAAAFDMDELVELINTTTSKPVYFVLDGIDDMQLNARQELLGIVLQLQDSITLRLCLATRSAKDVFHGARQAKLTRHATMPSINPDIETYVQTEVDGRLATKMLNISNNDLVREVKEKLVAGSEGMFLWVHLQIVSLSSMLSDKQIREAIEDLPKGLTETYGRLLQTQGYSESQHSRHMFELVLAARRPLDYEEMREALSVEPGNIEYHPDTLLNSLHGILRSCSGLVLLDEEEETLRLVHSSARQFLTTSAYTRIQKMDYETKMTETILTYINYSLFENRVALYGPRVLNAAAVPAALIVNKLPMASKFIRFSRNRDLDAVLYNAGTRRKHIRFKDYVTAHWDLHLMAADVCAEKLRLLEAALTARRLDINVEHAGMTPLQRAVEVSSIDLVDLFLQHNPSVLDKKSATVKALWMKNSKIAISLVQERDHVFDEPFWRTHFDMALNNHGGEVIDILHNRYCSIRASVSQYVLRNGVEMMALLLLKSSGIDNLTFREKYESLNNKTPWMYTVEHHRYDMLRLLSTNPIVNPKGALIGFCENEDLQCIPEPLKYAIEHEDLMALDILTMQAPAVGFKVDQDDLWECVFKPNHKYRHQLRMYERQHHPDECRDELDKLLRCADKPLRSLNYYKDGRLRIMIVHLMLEKRFLHVETGSSLNPLFKAVFLAEVEIVIALLKYDATIVNRPHMVSLNEDTPRGKHTAWDLCSYRRWAAPRDEYSSEQFEDVRTVLEKFGGRRFWIQGRWLPQVPRPVPFQRELQ